MNERIRELYKQSHISTQKQVRKGGWDNDREPFEYKTVTEINFDPGVFAELIVRECANIAYEYDAPKMSGPGMIIAGRIETHFGIEE